MLLVFSGCEHSPHGQYHFHHSFCVPELRTEQDKIKAEEKKGAMLQATEQLAEAIREEIDVHKKVVFSYNYPNVIRRGIASKDPKYADDTIRIKLVYGELRTPWTSSTFFSKGSFPEQASQDSQTVADRGLGSKEIRISSEGPRALAVLQSTGCMLSRQIFSEQLFPFVFKNPVVAIDFFSRCNKLIGPDLT